MRKVPRIRHTKMLQLRKVGEPCLRWQDHFCWRQDNLKTYGHMLLWLQLTSETGADLNACRIHLMVSLQERNLIWPKCKSLVPLDTQLSRIQISLMLEAFTIQLSWFCKISLLFSLHLPADQDFCRFSSQKSKAGNDFFDLNVKISTTEISVVRIMKNAHGMKRRRIQCWHF